MSIFSKNEINELENFEKSLDLENKSKKRIFANKLKTVPINEIDKKLEETRKQRDEAVKEKTKKNKSFIVNLLKLFGL